MNKGRNRSDLSDLHFKTVGEVAGLVQNREISSIELTRSILKRIETFDPILKSYAAVMADQALAAAMRADEEIATGRYRGPLHGIPVAVKDLCFTKGVRTTGGTLVLSNHIPDYDATVVTRLEAAGAVLIGKLNMTEAAGGGYHPGFEIPLNPWDHSVWSGASSSGSAVATTAGLAYAALGSDTGGSIRFPAAACGVVGLKPTWGRVSRYGVLALAESLDHVGPLTRSVADAAIVLQATAGHDPHDPTSLHEPVPDMMSTIGDGIQGVRIGVDERFVTENADPELAHAVLSGVEVLGTLGAKVTEIQMPDLSDFLRAWATICTAEAVLAHEATYPSRRSDYGPSIRDLLDLGLKVTGADYARANNLRAAWKGVLNQILEDTDVLACPSMSRPPWPVTPEALYGPLGELDPSFFVFTAPFNLTGVPTLSVPCGFTESGLPLSLQFVGRHLNEQLLCRVGHAYESATEWHMHRPEISA